MVLADILLSDTGDIAFNGDLIIVEGLNLVYQNMLRFLRSEAEDVPTDPSMAFGIRDYLGLPNTKASAEIIRSDFLDKISFLDAFSEHIIDVDVYPTDIKDLKMEITIEEQDNKGESLVIAGNILMNNGFIQNIPDKFNSDIYDTSSTVTIIETVTITERDNKIRVKYNPDISSVLVFNSTDAVTVNEEDIVTNLQTISGTIVMAQEGIDYPSGTLVPQEFLSISLDDEIPILKDEKIILSSFSVSGVTLTKTGLDPSPYEYIEDSIDGFDLTFGDTHEALGYVIDYEDIIIRATGIVETERELPPPEYLAFSFATENVVHDIILERYLNPGTYIIQYRTSPLL